jgi:uncharacterized protein (DUF433 family)
VVRCACRCGRTGTAFGAQAASGCGWFHVYQCRLGTEALLTRHTSDTKDIDATEDLSGRPHLQRKLGIAATSSQLPHVNFLERITVDPEQCGGKPCIRGLRIRVKDVLEMLGSGMSEADILAEFPYLESDDIRASQLYAARLTDHTVLRSA